MFVLYAVIRVCALFAGCSVACAVWCYVCCVVYVVCCSVVHCVLQFVGSCLMSFSAIVCSCFVLAAWCLLWFWCVSVVVVRGVRFVVW